VDYENIIYEKKEGVGIITFNRPEQRNALSLQLVREMRQALEEIEEDDDVKVMIITGGPACFSTGGDLAEVGKEESRKAFDVEGHVAFEKIAQLSKPTIAAISGWCVAGGLEIAMCCDMRVASATARIGDAHIKMGLIGGGGGPARLPRLIPVSKAKELLFTGDSVDAEEALRLGLVNRVAPLETYMDAAMELARKIAKHSLLGLRLTKRAVNWALNMNEYQAVEYTRVCSNDVLASAEFKERIRAFLSKQK